MFHYKFFKSMDQDAYMYLNHNQGEKQRRVVVDQKPNWFGYMVDRCFRNENEKVSFENDEIEVIHQVIFFPSKMMRQLYTTVNWDDEQLTYDHQEGRHSFGLRSMLSALYSKATF